MASVPSTLPRDEFAQALNRARLTHHLSVRAAAKTAGVPAATVQGWLNGKHFPTPALRNNYLRLVDALGLTDELPEDLWGEPLSAVQPTLREGNPPYLGLRPFGVDDHIRFYGRKAESERLAQAVAALAATDGTGIVALVGPSGSGKSSLLAAGLIAGECREGVLAGWRARGLSVSELADLTTEGPGPDEDLIVVDQFEDALLLDGQARTAALDGLTRLSGRAVVVIGLRSDAYAEASQEPALLRGLSRPVLLSPLTRTELREVIVAPARQVDIGVDEDLVLVLEQELAPGASRTVVPDILPLLSNALLVTWAAGHGERMTVADYHAAGGVAQAVESLAEQVYCSLSPAGQASAKTLFLRLIRLASDVVVREPLRLSALDPDVRAVMDPFVAARMLTVTGDVVRISHDALLNHWSRLNTWIDESRTDLAVLAQVRRAAQLWIDTERDPDSLIPVGRLTLFQDWFDESGRHLALLTEPEREYVRASEEHFATVLDQEKRASQRLRRRGRLALGLAAVTTALAVIAGFLFWQGQGFQRQAEQARNDAQSRQVATAASSIRSQDPNLQAQMALVAADISDTQEGRSALLDAAALDAPIRWVGSPTSVVAVSPDEKLVARANGAGQVTLWRGDELTTSAGATFAADPGGNTLYAAALGQSRGRALLAVGGGGVRRLWDVTAEPVLVADLQEGESTTFAAAFSTDGSLLAFGTSDGTVQLWSVADPGSPRLDRTLSLDAVSSADGGDPARPQVSSVAFGPDGLLVVAGATGSVARWRLGGSPRRLPDLPTALKGTPVRVLALAISPDGRRLAAGLRDRGLLRWNLDGEEATAQPALTMFTSWVNAVAFSADGRTLIAGSSDQSTRTFDSATGDLVRQLPGPSIVTGVAVVQGRPVATATDGTLRIWPAVSPLWRAAGTPVYNMSTDATGSRWLSGGTASEGTVLWRLGDRPRPVPVPRAALGGDDAQVGATAVAPNGGYLLGGTRQGKVISWPLSESGVGRPVLADAKVGSIGFTAISPDSSLVAAMEHGGTRTVLFSSDGAGRLTYRSTIETPLPQLLSFSPDGRILAVALAANKVQLWSMTDPVHPAVAGEITDFASATISVAYAPMSALLAVGSDAGEVTVWDTTDPAAPRRVHEFGDAHSSAYAVMFSPDARTLVAATGDGVVWGWDLAAPTPKAEFALNGELGRTWDVRFIDNGAALAVGGDNGGVRVWVADAEAARERLCRSRGDALTEQEWRRYLPGIEPRDPC